MINKLKSNLLKNKAIRLKAEDRAQMKRYSLSPKLYHIYEKYESYTMEKEFKYVRNLALVEQYKDLDGCIVECGTWRGGMIAGIAELLKDQNRQYYLFDSFEGLPPADDIDGQEAKDYQINVDAPDYLDNCAAEESYALEAMGKSSAKKYKTIKGWFSDTLPSFVPDQKIAILRLDGDWYQSTMDCFVNLYKHVIPGGIIILDDYYYWEGCTKATHDFLSSQKSGDPICQYMDAICYIKKK